MGDQVSMRFNLIGYNEKGFIGFMTGGSYLSYLETPKNADELVKKLNLPYISHEDVKSVNKYSEEHNGELKIAEFKKEGQKNAKRKVRKKKVQSGIQQTKK